MRFEKIPYYLRQSIDAIVSDARKKITVHYTENRIMAGTSQSRSATGCQIIDHNNYGEYFYEPNKFEILEPKVIKCMDQRSAHQNGILALKRWENEVREFLSRPIRKMEEPVKAVKKTIDRTKSHPTSTIQIKEVLSSVGREQKIRNGRRVIIH